jgi:hypothetical protein
MPNCHRQGAPNPNGHTRVFMGNLAYTIDDKTLTDFLKDCGAPQNIHWLSDKV